MNAKDLPKVENGISPRLQIIRGVPGTGKTTVAKAYPCIHIELDQFCCRSGLYRWGEERDREGSRWVVKAAKDAMRNGIDVVVSGVLAHPNMALGFLVYYAMTFGYEVWIQDMTQEFGNVHGCRLADMERYRNSFVPFNDDMFAHVFTRYPKDRDAIKVSIDDYEALVKYVRAHVHAGLMPNDYQNLPEIDGH